MSTFTDLKTWFLNFEFFQFPCLTYKIWEYTYYWLSNDNIITLAQNTYYRVPIQSCIGHNHVWDYIEDSVVL